MTETVSIFTVLEYFVRGFVSLLMGGGSVPAEVPYHHFPDVKQSAIVFVEADEPVDSSAVANDIALIENRLRQRDFLVKKVWQDGNRVALHVTGAPWDGEQFESILVKGNLFIGEMDETDDWKAVVNESGKLPDGIELETMPQFARPALVSSNKAVLKKQFSKLENKGLVPFLFCPRRSDATLPKCALQVLARSHSINPEHVDATAFTVDRDELMPIFSMQLFKPETMEMDPVLREDLLGMQRVILVMDGEALSAPAQLWTVSPTELTIAFDDEDEIDFADSADSPSILELKLSIFASGLHLQNRWQFIHREPVITPVRWPDDESF